MTERPGPARRSPKRRRPHPAAAGRVLVVGAATAGTLAMAGLMARPVDPAGAESTAPTAATPASVGGATAVSVAPGTVRVVVVRRHHPAPADGSVARTPSVAASAASRPAPPVRPAPRPAPARTTSSGS